MTPALLKRHGLSPKVASYHRNLTMALACLVHLPEGPNLLLELRKAVELEHDKGNCLYPADSAAIAVRELQRLTKKSVWHWWKK